MGYYGGWDPREQLLAPARRAGLLMIILGAIAMGCGGCFFGGSFLPLNQLPPDSMAQLRQLEQMFDMPITRIMRILGVVLLIPGLAFIGSGIFVRRGTLAGIVIASILTVMAILYLAFNALGQLGAGEPAGACLTAIVIGPTILVLVWLFQANRNRTQLMYFSSQYPQAYGHYPQMPPGYPQPPYPQQSYLPQGGYPPPYVPQPPIPPPPPPANQEPPQAPPPDQS
jgi:hypothetical protein